VGASVALFSLQKSTAGCHTDGVANDKDAILWTPRRSGRFAASVAGLLITTEAIVAELPKKEPAMPAMPGGGMGGMDN
jgi:hypothetical protein